MLLCNVANKRTRFCPPKLVDRCIAILTAIDWHWRRRERAWVFAFRSRNFNIKTRGLRRLGLGTWYAGSRRSYESENRPDLDRLTFFYVDRE